MSTKILFLSIESFKDNYLIDNNLQDEYIFPNLRKVQDFRIKPLLGPTLYSAIELEISGGTLSPLNKLLVEEYIQPIIAYSTQAEILYATAYKLKNEGIGNGDDKSAQYRFREIIELSSKYENDSKTYENLLIKYMINNGIPVDCRYQYKSQIFFPSLADYFYGHTIAHKNNKK